jgi:hypothetical protein
MKGPSTLLEFETIFPNEESCWSRLRAMRWPRGFRCPRCGERRSYALERMWGRRRGCDDPLAGPDCVSRRSLPIVECPLVHDIQAQASNLRVGRRAISVARAARVAGAPRRRAPVS